MYSQSPYRNVNVNYPSPPVPSDNSVQTDTPRIPVVLPPGTRLEPWDADTNRLDGDVRFTLTAENALTPDAGIMGYLSRFVAVSAATGTLLTLCSTGLGGFWIALFAAAPIAGFTVAVYLNGSKWTKIISVYLLSAIALGTLPFTVWAIQLLVTGIMFPAGRASYRQTQEYVEDRSNELNERHNQWERQYNQRSPVPW